MLKKATRNAQNMENEVLLLSSAKNVERLKESGETNTTEKIQLKDTLEEPDDKPKIEKERELKRPKRVDNR